jgi:HSP20 family protein
MTHVKFNRRPFEANFNNLVEDIFSEFPVLFKNEWKGIVPVNIKESDSKYILEVIAPGFEKPDFKINLEQDVLTISAEKKENAETTENEKQIRKEYSVRTFKRSFTVDNKIDSGKIEAKYVNGILILTLPKKEPAKTTQEIVIN